MSQFRAGFVVAALALSAYTLNAQQPARMQLEGRHMSDSAMGQHMRTMDSLNAHMDGLVARMNTVAGDRKVAAMADVINALIAERRMMHAHMRQMMAGAHGMAGHQPGPGMNPPVEKGRPGNAPAPKDTSHAEHHPPP